MVANDEIRRRKKIVLLGLLVALFLLTAGALPLMTGQERAPTATALVGIEAATPAVQPSGSPPVATRISANFEVTAARPAQPSASPTPVVVDQAPETGGESQGDTLTPRLPVTPTSSQPPTVEATSVATVQSKTTTASQAGDDGNPSPTGQAEAGREPEPAESAIESEPASPTAEVTAAPETEATAETVGRETEPAESTAESELASPTAEATAAPEAGATVTAETTGRETGSPESTGESEPASPTAEVTATPQTGATVETAGRETGSSESTAESEPASPTTETTAAPETRATATVETTGRETGSSESTTGSTPANPTAEVTAAPEEAVAEATADLADELQVEPPPADPNIAEHMRGEIDEPAQSDNQTASATAASAWPEDSRAEAIALARESQATHDGRPALGDIPPESLPVTGVRVVETSWVIIGLAFGIVFLLALFGMAAVDRTTDRPD